MIVPSSWTIQFLCANFDFADQNFLIKFLELEKSTFWKNCYCIEQLSSYIMYDFSSLCLGGVSTLCLLSAF